MMNKFLILGHEPAEERVTEPEKRVATEAERRISEGNPVPGVVNPLPYLHW